MNPTGAPSPRAIRVESSRGFLSCQRVRASAPAGVAPEPQVVQAKPVGVLSPQACMHVFQFETEFCLTMALLCSRGVFKRGDWIETELNDPGVGARRESDEEVFCF